MNLKLLQHKNIIRKYLKADILISLIILGCFLYLLNLTWLKWGDLIIDSGREMYIPLAIAEGKLLYRDILYIYGPFTPYLQALIFKIFGPHLDYLIFSGIVTALLVTMLVYKISRIFLDLLSTTLVTLTFLFVFAFGQYVYLGIFNFILPYSYSATHSILFALIALYLFIKFIFTQKKRYVLWYSLFLSLSLLCKFEIGLAALGAFVLCLIIHYLAQEKKSKISWPIYLSLFLPLFIFIIAFSPFLLKAGPLTIFKTNFLDSISVNLNKDNIYGIYSRLQRHQAKFAINR